MPIRIFPASVDGPGLRGGGHSYPSSWDQEVHLKDITENKAAGKVLGTLANERQKLAMITGLTDAGIWEWSIRTAFLSC